MTVSLLIEDESIPDDGKRLERAESIPVATSDYFRGVLDTGAKALELRYVPQFYDPGIPLSQEDLPDVLLELAALKTWMSKNFPNGQDAGMLQRIDTVTDALRRCVGRDDIRISIG